MKKFTLVFAMLLALALTACAGQTAADADRHAAAQSAAAADVWPVNDCTEGLPVPPGTVVWATADAARGSCGVGLTDVAEGDCRGYMVALAQAGFFAVEAVSEPVGGENSVSIGTLLSNGEKGISVSYVPNQLTIYISMEN